MRQYSQRLLIQCESGRNDHTLEGVIEPDTVIDMDDVRMQSILFSFACDLKLDPKLIHLSLADWFLKRVIEFVSDFVFGMN